MRDLKLRIAMSSPVCQQPHAVGLEDRLAVAHVFADERRRKRLAPVDRQLRPRLVAVHAGRIRALRRVHAGAARLGHPRGQRHRRHRLARRDVFRDPARDALPAGRLPDLERPALPAEAPADREIDVARVVRDVREVHGAVMPGVAVDRPQEARLGMVARVQLLEALGDVAVLEDLRDALVGLAFRRAGRRRSRDRARGCRGRLSGRRRAASSAPSAPSSIRRFSHGGHVVVAGATGSFGSVSFIVLTTCANVSSPTTSAVRNVALFGRPMSAPVSASTVSKPEPEPLARDEWSRASRTRPRGSR